VARASSQWFKVGFVLWLDWLLSCSLLRLLGRSIFQYWAAFPWRPWRSVSGLIPQGDSTQSARGSKGGRGLVQYWQGTTDKRVVSPKGESIFELFCLSRPLGTYNPSKEKLRDRQTSKVKPHGYQLQSLVYLESDLSAAVSINTIFGTYLGVTSSEGIYQSTRGTRGGPTVRIYLRQPSDSATGEDIRILQDLAFNSRTVFPGTASSRFRRS